MVLQKTIVEGKYMDILALSDIKIVAPAFEKLSHAKLEIHTQQFLSFPILDVSQKLVATIQLQSKFQEIRSKIVGVKDKQHFQGFHTVDAQLL